jgi:hypothetical protein
MKPITRNAVTVCLILFMALSANSYAKKKPQASKSTNNPGITYVVTIEPQATGEVCHPYYVVIRGEFGDQVEGALLYQEGITNYVFRESGPVVGTRTASLERSYGSGQYQCNSILETEPFLISGEFRNGSTYLFPLHPDVVYGLD